MFNETIKNEFAELDGKERHIKLFKKTSTKEHELSKDLFDFSREELFSLAEDKRELVLIRNYIDWAMRQGYTRHNTNFLMI